jgi:hypothetical protein
VNVAPHPPRPPIRPLPLRPPSPTQRIRSLQLFCRCRSVAPLDKSPRTSPACSTAANSFRFRSYANRRILHYFGANKSFRIRSYRNSTRNPFIIRSYENTQGVASPLLVNPALCPPCLSGKSSPGCGVRLPRSSRITGHESQATPSITTFKINTCVSVASKRLYPPLESTLTKKPGEGGGVCF